MRTAVIEIGATSTRAVVAEPQPAGAPMIHLDRRIVLALHRPITRDGRIGDGHRLLLVETVRRLQEGCFRLGVSNAGVVIAAAVGQAADVADLVSELTAAGIAASRVRTARDEADLLFGALHAAPTAAAQLAEVGEHCTTLVGRTEREPVIEVLPGVLALHASAARRQSVRGRAEHLLAGVRPPPAAVDVPILLGPVTGAVGRALALRRLASAAQSVDGLVVSAAELAFLADELLRASPTERLLLPAVPPDEADLVTLGAVYLHTLLLGWQRDHAQLSAATVSEGQVLASLAAAEAGPFSSPRRRTGAASRSGAGR